MKYRGDRNNGWLFIQVTDWYVCYSDMSVYHQESYNECQAAYIVAAGIIEVKMK